MALGFIFALVTSGAVWMMGSDRIQAVAAYDGAFFPWFGVFNEQLGTPVRVNVMSGITSTIFMVAAVKLLSSSEAATFTVVLYMAISTTLLSYILIFPALIKLRYSHPDVPRLFRVPGGDDGMWVVRNPLHGLGAAGLLGGDLPRHARVPVRRRLRLRRLLGRHAASVRGVHARARCWR